MAICGKKNLTVIFVRDACEVVISNGICVTPLLHCQWLATNTCLVYSTDIFQSRPVASRFGEGKENRFCILLSSFGGKSDDLKKFRREEDEDTRMCALHVVPPMPLKTHGLIYINSFFMKIPNWEKLPLILVDLLIDGGNLKLSLYREESYL